MWGECELVFLVIIVSRASRWDRMTGIEWKLSGDLEERSFFFFMFSFNLLKFSLKNKLFSHRPEKDKQFSSWKQNVHSSYIFYR